MVEKEFAILFKRKNIDASTQEFIPYKVIEGKQILWCETSFKDDVKDGISIEYEDDGKTIKQKTMWKNGEKIENNT